MARHRTAYLPSPAPAPVCGRCLPQCLVRGGPQQRRRVERAQQLLHRALCEGGGGGHGHDRQPQVRRLRGAHVDGVVGDRRAVRGRVLEREPCVGVGVVLRGVAAADVHSDAVAGVEDVAGAPQVDLNPVGLAGVHGLWAPMQLPPAHPLDAVLQQQPRAVREDVYQFGREVRVRRVAAHVQHHRRVPCDGHVLGQRGGGVRQDIPPALGHRQLVPGPAGDGVLLVPLPRRCPHDAPAARPHRVRGVVEERRRRRRRGRALRQAPARRQVPGLWRGVGQRGPGRDPIALAALQTGAHHVPEGPGHGLEQHLQ
mmetsp:Transcript_17500/g.30262  ORF Transcript_17500/g.30262 Transcript_17500/m.30262 type:complete len:312 (+) Transcript_17500:1944-2879(+)